VTTAIDLQGASGSLVAFPYPVDNVTGKMTVYEDHIQIEQARYKKGDADLLVKGSVNWGTDEERRARPPGAKPVLKPKLQVVAHNVPVDESLLNALPPMQSKWLRRVGAAGKFDLDGALSCKGPDLDFIFDVALHDCSLWPQGNSYAVTGVNGSLKLTPQKLVLTDVRGKRGESDLTTHGEINWPTHPPQVQIVAEAKNLTLDDALYRMLPEPAQKGWKSVAPQGTVDAKINFTGVPSTEPIASIDEALPTTQPAQTYELVVTPRNLTVTPQAIPYRLDNLSGTVTIAPGAVTFHDITGHHGGADVHISGTGATEASGAWDIKLAGEKMFVDDDLKKAVPDALRSIADSSQLQGTIAFNFSKLKIWSDPITPTTSPSIAKPGPSGPGKPAPESTVNVDYAAKLTIADGSLTTGVPLAHVTGSADFTGSTRHGKLTDLSGSFDVPSLEISGRPAQNFRADLSKRQGQQVLRLANIQTQMVGGQVAGQIEWETPDSGPARYAMALVLHNADVATLTGDAMPNVHAALSASLAMQGNLDDEGSRRGGGDIAVTGTELYKIPIVMGLLQITTLSLPITSPFNEGTCKYSVDGTRVTFETIELRAKEMTMSGNGHLDYNTGRVALSFSTQSKSWLKLPVVNDLLQGARNELLQIHVRGTIQEPKVSTTSMGTFSTTVDEVIKGGNPPPDLPPVKKSKKAK
jgi:hypothetical protein